MSGPFIINDVRFSHTFIFLWHVDPLNLYELQITPQITRSIQVFIWQVNEQSFDESSNTPNKRLALLSM